MRQFANVLVANNTVVEPYVLSNNAVPVIGFDAGFPDYHDTTWRNNIFYVGGGFRYLSKGFIATFYNNDFFLVDPSYTQYGLNTTTNGNIILNPRFVRYDPTQNFDYQDFHLQSGSPAAGMGIYP